MQILQKRETLELEWAQLQALSTDEKEAGAGIDEGWGSWVYQRVASGNGLASSGPVFKGE